MRRRITSGVVVVGLFAAFTAVAGADIVSRGPDGTIAVATGTAETSDTTLPAEPARPALPAKPGPASGGSAPGELERSLGDVAPGLDAEERRDLERDIDEGLDDLEIDLDELDADLEEQADILSDIEHDDGVEGSKQLRSAEERLSALEGEFDGLDARVSDIGRRVRAALRDSGGSDELSALIADVRALGAALDAFDVKIDALEVLVSDAEDQQRDRDDRRR